MFSQPQVTSRLLVVLVSLSMGSAVAPRALAADSTPGLVVETVAERRVQSNGGVAFVRAERLHVGDEIFYTLRVHNASNNSLPQAVIIKAIPRNTHYVANSAAGPATLVDFSVDGGLMFGGPEQLSVRTANGAARAALTDDYTHIRWRLRHPLATGATALLRFRTVFQ